jgi:hypothetical protein
MRLLVLLSMLAFAPAAQAGYATVSEAAEALAPEMQTGTLLVSEGDCLAVKVFTRSPYTHVAAVVVRRGQPFVYDSANGVGVRCQPLERYLKSQNVDEIHILHPAEPLSDEEALKFEEHLDSQLGRPYSIKHHLSGKRARGVHCSEYVVDALQACELMHAKQPPRVSPASLVQGIEQTQLYAPMQIVQLKQPPPTEPEKLSWCSRLWLDTKSCTRKSCAKVKGWFLCR